MSRNFARGTDVVDLGDITEARFLTGSAWSYLVFWRSENTSADDNCLVAKWGGTSADEQILVRQANGTAPRPVQVRAASALKITGSACQLNTWHCTAVTNDGLTAADSLTLYTKELDGTIIDDAVASSSSYFDEPDLTQRIALGNDGGSPMDGDLAYAIYVSGQVTKQEWLDYIADPVGMFFYFQEKYGVVFFHPLGGYESTEPDWSGNGHDGSLTGTTRGEDPPAAMPKYGHAQSYLEIAAAGTTVTPATAIATATAIAPTVVLGSVSPTPAVASAVATAVLGSVVLGSVTKTPDPASALATAIDPTVDISGGGAVNVTPSTAAAVASAIAPALQFGSVTITPAVAAAVATAPDPTVSVAVPPTDFFPYDPPHAISRDVTYPVVVRKS